MEIAKDFMTGFGFLALILVSVAALGAFGVLLIILLPIAIALVLPTLLALLVVAILVCIVWIGHLVNKW